MEKVVCIAEGIGIPPYKKEYLETMNPDVSGSLFIDGCKGKRRSKAMSEGIKPTSREEWEQYLRDNLPDGSKKCPECDGKDAEILKLREENRKLREAVVKERASVLSLESMEFGDGTLGGEEASREQAERELRAEGVIE